MLTVATLTRLEPYKSQLPQSPDLAGLNAKEPVIRGNTLAFLRWAFFVADARTAASKPI